MQGCYGCTILLYVLLLMANLLLVFIVWVLHDCCTIMPSFTPTGNSKRENLVLLVKKFGICYVVSCSDRRIVAVLKISYSEYYETTKIWRIP